MLPEQLAYETGMNPHISPAVTVTPFDRYISESIMGAAIIEEWRAC